MAQLLERLGDLTFDISLLWPRFRARRRSDLRWVVRHAGQEGPSEYYVEGPSDWLAPPSADGADACVVRYLRSGHWFGGGVMTDGELAWKDWFAECPTGDLGKVRTAVGERLSSCRVPDICSLEYDSWNPHTWLVNGWNDYVDDDLFPFIAGLDSSADVVEQWVNSSGDDDEGPDYGLLLRGMILFPSAEYVTFIEEYLSSEGADISIHLHWRSLLEVIGVIGDSSLVRWLDVIVEEVVLGWSIDAVGGRVHVVAGWASMQLPGEEAAAVYASLCDRVDGDFDALVHAFDVRRSAFLAQFDASKPPRAIWIGA